MTATPGRWDDPPASSETCRSRRGWLHEEMYRGTELNCGFSAGRSPRTFVFRLASRALDPCVHRCTPSVFPLPEGLAPASPGSIDWSNPPGRGRCLSRSAKLSHRSGTPGLGARSRLPSGVAIWEYPHGDTDLSLRFRRSDLRTPPRRTVRATPRTRGNAAPSPRFPRERHRPTPAVPLGGS